MAKRIDKKNLPPLTTSLMREETEQQYHAWLLYNETGSLSNLLRTWQRLHQGYTNPTPEIEGIRGKLNQPPAPDTLKNWCRKYQWVKRTELLLAEEMAHLKEKAERFRAKRKFFLTDILISKMTKLQKQARIETSTVPEVRSLWEMHRTEFDESTGKTTISHVIDESEQVPPTSEDQELGREINTAIKKYYDKQR